MRRATERRALLGVSGAALAVVVAGLVHASASTLDARASDLVASGTTQAAPGCDQDVSTRLVFTLAGGVESDRVEGIAVADIDPLACAGATVTASAFDGQGHLLLTGSAVLASGSSDVRLDGLAPVPATSVRSIVVEIS